jgi:hypothetical protein
MMNDINLVAAPIENEVTRHLVELLQEARAGRIVSLVTVVVRGPEQGQFFHFGNVLHLTMSGLCAEISERIRKVAFAPSSPIIRAVGDVPRNN